MTFKKINDEIDHFDDTDDIDGVDTNITNNINEFGDFANPVDDAEKQLSEINQKIVMRYKARNARKGLTTIIGLPAFDFNTEKMNVLAKNMKKKFGCACYVKVVEGLTVIEIQGNKIGDASAMLINDYDISPKKISSL